MDYKLRYTIKIHNIIVKSKVILFTASTYFLIFQNYITFIYKSWQTLLKLLIVLTSCWASTDPKKYTYTRADTCVGAPVLLLLSGGIGLVQRSYRHGSVSHMSISTRLPPSAVLSSLHALIKHLIIDLWQVF